MVELELAADYMVTAPPFILHCHTNNIMLENI